MTTETRGSPKPFNYPSAVNAGFGRQRMSEYDAVQRCE